MLASAPSPISLSSTSTWVPGNGSASSIDAPPVGAVQETVNVTSSDTSQDESVTNVQHAGVDEGGIVKLHGNYLVVLRRGRLFTIDVSGDAAEGWVHFEFRSHDPRDGYAELSSTMGLYHVHYVHTADGWRMHERIETAVSRNTASYFSIPED